MNLRGIRQRNKRRVVWEYTYRIDNGEPVRRRIAARDVTNIGVVRLDDAVMEVGQILTISGTAYFGWTPEKRR